MNWIVETITSEDFPIVKETTLSVGQQRCSCCFVFRTRAEAKQLELKFLRNYQQRILAELADCENRIVTVMRELNLTAKDEV